MATIQLMVRKSAESIVWQYHLLARVIEWGDEFIELGTVTEESNPVEFEIASSSNQYTIAFGCANTNELRKPYIVLRSNGRDAGHKAYLGVEIMWSLSMHDHRIFDTSPGIYPVLLDIMTNRYNAIMQRKAANS